MDEAQTLSHSKWECKYQVGFIPKCRRKTLYAPLRRDLVSSEGRAQAQFIAVYRSLGGSPVAASSRAGNGRRAR